MDSHEIEETLSSASSSADTNSILSRRSRLAPKQPITTAKAPATSSAALQHGDLMPQGDRFQQQCGAPSVKEVLSALLCGEGSIVERYFVRKQEGRGPVGELNQIHGSIQIPDLPENNRPFIKPGSAYVIPYRPKQSTMLFGRQSHVHFVHLIPVSKSATVSLLAIFLCSYVVARDAPWVPLR